ncbi:multiple epidermal growth factor-like domains protein 10 [Ruditapes philippinarum]|uniref:multiple epidermal growth factor-like domains protein 10 n=1 Tax=Ruditapes philippinarum TaxID=129788 RepID=UPI00295B0F42|nr:multiple epidermal growth factor-like domains protein 10 [Ruditapes philippinarum]
MDPHVILFIIFLGTSCIKVNAGQHICASTCENGCDFFTRACNNCTNSRYDQFCDGKCSPFCVNSCDRYTGNCDSCIQGKYASWCIESCSEGCSSGCDMENGNCFLCKVGWYGIWCNTPCPSGCYGECNRITGDCLKCKTDFFGRHCNVPCVETGCLDGCDKYYGICNSCQSGFYGESCNIKCTDTCMQSKCDSFSGNCIDCIQGYYGLKCNQSRPEHCNGICNFQTGSCFSCVNGYFGEHCTDKCPENCKGTCGANAKCFSCKNGFFGDRCQNTCSQHCSWSCNQQTGECFTYRDGYWGETCQESCGEHCTEPCHKNNGHCYTCHSGWYGQSCEQSCPTACQNTSCLASGVCQSCITGFYGDKCEKPCTNCVNDTCRQSDGFCVYGCTNGSDCKTMVSTTIGTSLITTNATVTSRVSTGTTTGYLTLWPVSTTEHTSATETFSTQTTTEVSKPSESGDSNVLIVITLIVSATLVLVCVGVAIYCIRKRKHGSKPKEEPETSKHVYTNAYDDIQEEYAEIGTPRRESLSYDDIENVIEEQQSPVDHYQRIDDVLGSTGETKQETMVKAVHGPSGNNVDIVTANAIAASHVDKNELNTDTMVNSDQITDLRTDACLSTNNTGDSSGSMSNSSLGYTQVLLGNETASSEILYKFREPKRDTVSNLSEATDLRVSACPRTMHARISSSDLSITASDYTQVFPAKDSIPLQDLNMLPYSRINTYAPGEMFQRHADALRKEHHTGFRSSESSSTLSRDYALVFPPKSSDKSHILDIAMDNQSDNDFSERYRTVEDFQNRREYVKQGKEEDFQNRGESVKQGRDSKCSDYASVN